MAGINLWHSMAICAIFLFSAVNGQNGIMGLINPRDIADLTQLAMRLGVQTMESNKELLSKPGRPESKPLSSDASPSELLGQSFTNLMNGGGMGLGGGMAGLMSDRSVPPIEKTQTVEKPVSSLPKEFGAPTLFKTSPLFPASAAAAKGVPTIQAAASASEPLPEAGGAGFGSGGGGYEAARGSPNGNIIPNIRQLLPGARENFGVKRGDGCLPFVSEFMQIAYGNCVKRAEERTWDAWGREVENGLTGGGINLSSLFRASKETCRMIAEREQCGQLRRAVSECDIINSIQIGMNMQRSIQRCDEVGGIIDQNPKAVMEGMNGLINGEVAQGFLNNFLG
uniref:Uncharacterized protein n=1 Tax=Panagrolaimus sp. ES5 TaxID=591445 RepID=A0AC34FUN2_9BILA